MALRVGSPNFSKGELGPELISRVDVGAYGAGAKRARNVVILKYGGLAKRPGTRIVAEVRDAAQPTRLVPFQFSLDQSYALEMGQGYMRPAALGGMVIEERLTITAISKAAQAQVTAAYHGYVVGDDVFFDGIVGMVEINGLIGRVTSVVDTNNFTVNIDSTAFSTFTGDAGGITRTAPAPTPTPTPVPVPPTPSPTPSPVGGGGGGSFGGGGGGFEGPNPIP